ncbi:tyrosine-type recombinase/integrase [Nonomuraea antimicrobica]
MGASAPATWNRNRAAVTTAARAAEILALNVEDLDLEHRRAPVRSKGGATEWVYWDSGTAHLLPRLLRLPDGSVRIHGPLFLSERRPVPARRSAAADICPHTCRARLGYDRARVLLDKYAGLDLHQLRHSAATHLGEAEIPLQLIMGKTRHKNPRTAMRYVKPGAEAIASDRSCSALKLVWEIPELPDVEKDLGQWIQCEGHRGHVDHGEPAHYNRLIDDWSDGAPGTVPDTRTA